MKKSRRGEWRGVLKKNMVVCMVVKNSGEKDESVLVRLKRRAGQLERSNNFLRISNSNLKDENKELSETNDELRNEIDDMEKALGRCIKQKNEQKQKHNTESKNDKDFTRYVVRPHGS